MELVDLGGGQVTLVPPNCLINGALPRLEGGSVSLTGSGQLHGAALVW